MNERALKLCHVGLLVVFMAVWGGRPALADCSGGAKPLGEDCGAVTITGCCDGETLLFCEGGQLCQLSCSLIQHCGWDGEKGLYDCYTDGVAAPGGTPAKECPTEPQDSCQGVDYRGCCSGSAVYWCQQGKLASLDCAGNETLTRCGWNEETGVANCVLESGKAGPVCGFEGGDIVTGDVGSPDVSIPLDSIVVPDLSAPSQCQELAAGYDVEAPDCGVFQSAFVVKQEGCVAVLAGLLAGSAHPAAKVTQSGMQFEFLDAGKKKLCWGTLADEGGEPGKIEGKCQWESTECTFLFTPREVVPPPKPEEKPAAKGGCAVSRWVSGGEAAGAASLLMLLLLATVLLRHRLD